MVTRLEIVRRKPDDLRLDVLPRGVRKALLECCSFRFLTCQEWYLAGGTALAFQAGHRQSVDLDFFSPRGVFPVTKLERRLSNTGHWATSFRDEGTLYGNLGGVKMSFIAYPFFQASSARIRCGNICMLNTSDIAAMKILTISQRGRKRDFIDLYWYCTNREPLGATIRRAIRQYPGQEHNMAHMLKSLVYFSDAEGDPMPKLFFRASWKTVKTYFRREVPRVARELLRLK